MKKLTVIIALVLCVGSAKAQYEKRACYFRPYMGFLFSNMESKAFRSDMDQKWKFNMTLGGQLEWQAMNSSSLLIDVNYRRQGCSLDYKGNDDHEEKVTKMTVDYLCLGLQWKMYLRPNFSARVGVELMNKIGDLTTHYCVQNKDVSVNEEEREHVDDIMDQTTWSVPVGLSYEYRNFTISATYHLDGQRISEALSSDDNTRSAWSSKREPVYFKAFDLTLGYTIPLKKRK